MKTGFQKTSCKISVRENENPHIWENERASLKPLFVATLKNDFCLFSKFPYAKENFYYSNNYYYLMWIWILNNPFPKKYVNLIAILFPVIIL